MSTKKAPKIAATKTKDTLYIDVDDEITAVIDKVVSSKHKIVAVVLPKHATVFQSIVNMKLLKKAASEVQKNIALITSDKAVLPIASTVGLHVAKTPSSKPEIPELAALTPSKVEPEDGVTAPEAASADNAAGDTDDSVIEIDNTASNTTSVVETTSASKKAKTKKKRSMTIPDFSKFSVRLALAGVVFALLIVLWVFGFVILPKATITIETDVSSVPINALLTTKVGAESLDVEEKILPAERVQVEKVDSATVEATGEKNIGAAASGVMNLTNCIDDGEDKIVPAGTAFSAGSLTFTTTEAVKLDFAIYAGNNCLSDDFGRDKDVPVVASAPGPEYNVNAQSYNSSISGIRAYGSEMSGGTSELVTVVSQEDVERATQQLEGTSKSAALEELRKQLIEAGKLALDASLTTGEPQVSVSPAVDTEASEVTVRSEITYAMVGVNESDLIMILDDEIKEQLEGQDKNIRDNGLSSANIQLVEQPDEATGRYSLETIATAGPELDQDAIKESIAGKKRGDIEKLLQAIDGVRNVTVNYSPAWITTTPKSAQKIELVLQEQDD
jgi:hypothetical protein